MATFLLKGDGWVLRNKSGTGRLDVDTNKPCRFLTLYLHNRIVIKPMWFHFSKIRTKSHAIIASTAIFLGGIFLFLFESKCLS